MPRWERQLTNTMDAPSRQEVARVIQAARGTTPTLETAGAVVEYRRGGQLSCGYLVQMPAGRRGYDVIDVDGQRRRLRRDKVVDLSTDVVPAHSRDEAQRALGLIDRRREQARCDVDMETLWRVALDAGERTWSLEELVELHDPEASDTTRRVGMLRALWRGDRFDRDRSSGGPQAQHGWRPRPAQIVRQTVAAERRREQEAAELAQLGAWLRRVADGGSVEPRPPRFERAVAWLEDAAIGRTPGGESAPVMRAAHLHGAGAAFDTLLRLGHWSEDENLELHRLQVPDGFSANLQAVAAAVDPESADAGWSGRRRWGGGTWCTSSGDLAFRSRRGLRGWRVDIHMAVPTLLVPPEGALDTEARLRGTDVDLLERRIPMLPDSLAEACRLTPEIPRPALCLRVRLTPELSLADVEIQASRVRPRGVMEPGLVAGSRPLRRLAELATALRARRRAAGAWERLDSSRLEVAGGRPQPARRSDVDVIDTEIGLLAAEAIGWLCEARGLPAIYERREPAAVPLLPESAKRAQTEDVEAVRSYLFDSRSPHPDQSVRPGVHAGFGLTCHAFGGRPLDSYADLAVQRQLLTLTGFGGSADSVAELEQVLLETWEAREAARLVEQTGRRYWSLRSLEGIGSQTHLQAIVVEQQGPGYLVLLAGHPTGAYVRALGNEVFEAAPGRRLLVRVEQVSARRNLLRLVAPRLA